MKIHDGEKKDLHNVLHADLNINGILQISFRKLDIYGFYVAYDGIWDVINDRQSHF